MRRVLAIDVLACVGCCGRQCFLATIEDPRVVTKILVAAALGLGSQRTPTTYKELYAVESTG